MKMNKEKVKEIIKFSFFKYFQNKWFVLFNLISLLSMVLTINYSTISSFIKYEGKKDTYEIAILDSQDLIYSKFTTAFEGNDTYTIEKIDDNNYTNENIKDNFIVLEIEPDNQEIFKLKFVSKEGINSEVYNHIIDNLKFIRNEYFKQKYSLDDEKINLLQSNVSVNRIMLGVDAENSELKMLVNLCASAFTYLIAVIIFTRIANEISQEKSSKSSEYILTAVSEKEYLFAKVFSNIAILVIQSILILSYYLVSASILSMFKVQLTDISLTDSLVVSGLSKDIVIYLLSLIFYNVVTLILMSIIQATLAAKTASSQEAGNTVSIMVIIMAILYVLTVFIIDPYSKANIVLYIFSVFPVISSFFVPAMFVIGQATWWQVVISIMVLILLIPKVFNYCAISFKNGLLYYTKNKNKKQLYEIENDTSLETLLNKRTFKQLGSVIGISLLFYIGSQTIIPMLIKVIIDAFFSNISNADKFLFLQMFSQIICLGLGYLFLSSYISNSEILKEKSNKELIISKFSIIIISLAIISILQIGLGLIYPALGLDYSISTQLESELAITSQSSLHTKILLLLTIAFTPAIMEELFFRKGLICLTKKHGNGFAILLSSLLFGFVHMNISQGLFAFIIGLILGGIYLYTRNIKLTMLIHAINNGFECLSLILPLEKTLVVDGSITSVPTIYSILMIFAILLVIFLGIILLIKNLARHEFREKIVSFFKKDINWNSFKHKHIYMFYDYIFDVSLVLIFVLGILQEKMYRNL